MPELDDDAVAFLRLLADQYHGNFEEERIARVLRRAAGAIELGPMTSAPADVATKERRANDRVNAALEALGEQAIASARMHTDPEYRRRRAPDDR